MQTITIVASRGGAFYLTDTEMLIGSAIVIGLIAWAVLSRVRQFRDRS